MWRGRFDEVETGEEKVMEGYVRGRALWRGVEEGKGEEGGGQGKSGGDNVWKRSDRGRR